MKRLLLWLIRFYRKNISPAKPPCCRFYPTCSQYAYEAISLHGAAKGSYLALRRLLRCHPFHAGGYDPVPPVKKTRHRSPNGRDGQKKADAPHPTQRP